MTAQELHEIYSENLKNLRKKSKMTQAEIAEKIGIHEKYYSQIETGRQWGSFETIAALAEVFAVEPCELFASKFLNASRQKRGGKGILLKIRESCLEIADSLEKYAENF